MYDIFFICYDEGDREKNWQRVLEFHNTAQRIDNVKGIAQAHVQCNSLAQTEKFWTIDGDNWLLQRLKLNHWSEPFCDLLFFQAVDSIDKIISTTGGVKLWRKDSIICGDMSKGDFCKNATRESRVVPIIFSEHRYDATPYEAWRHSFRHMVKSYAGIITRDVLGSNIAVLEKHLVLNRYSYQGYLDAKQYVEECAGDFEKINLINDYDWLLSKAPQEVQPPFFTAIHSRM